MHGAGQRAGATPGAEVPRVAVLMTTYRHEAYVGAALEAALAQSWPNLDVIVADDASDDRTFEVVTGIAGRYRGPHRLVLLRHGRNGGAGQNLVHAMRCTEADFFVLSHGDDVSAPNRVQRVAETWVATGASLIAHQALAGPDQASAKPLAPDANVSGFVPLVELCRHAWTPHMLGASFSFERRVFTEFGQFDRARLPRGGDHVMPTRAAMLGGFYYLHEPLLFWRRHGGQMTQSTADFDGSPASHLETWKAYDLNALLYRLDEVRAFIARRGETQALVEAERTLIATMARMTREWAGARGALEGQGASLRFVPRARVTEGAGA